MTFNTVESSKVSNGRFVRYFLAALLATGGSAVFCQNVFGETIVDAMIHAYHNNPTLNAQRAASRAVDEGVAIAKSGYRPTVTFDAEIGHSSTLSSAVGGSSSTDLSPGEIGVTVTQVLWDSNRTRNNVSSALSDVSASHETLRDTEQDILLDAATAFLDVMRDRNILDLQRKNLAFLKEQVRSEQSRRRVGNATRTDVAQAQADQAAAQADVSSALANLKTSQAVFRQVVGKKPSDLKYRGAVLKFPKLLSSGFRVAESENPAIVSAKHLIDKALFDVKAAESELLPRIDLSAKAVRSFDQTTTASVSEEYSVDAALEIPIYQAGSQSAIIRQNKELLGQSRTELYEAIDAVRAEVVSAYAEHENAVASQIASQEQVRAASLAVEGVIKEREVGERTTLDVLSTQSTLIEAEIELENSIRDARLARFVIAAAIGRLSISNISEKVVRYEPTAHLEEVKDRWYGLRTVSGQ